MNGIEGIDVWAGQGIISLADYRRLRQQGKRFVVAKCMEGTTLDPRYVANTTAAGAAGLNVGAYFPLHPDVDPVKQARDHFAASKGVGTRPGELAPWCDTELMRGRTPDQVLEATIAWCNEATLLWKRRVTVYTYPYFDHAALMTGAVDGASLAQTNLAMAAYQVQRPSCPPPWTTMLFCQDSGGKEVPGVPVFRVPNGAPCDHDWFLGTEDEYLAACTPAPPAAA